MAMDDEIPAPPWLHLLRPQELAWRESEILRGRNPDSYIEKQLIEAGTWKRPAGEKGAYPSD